MALEGQAVQLAVVGARVDDAIREVRTVRGEVLAGDARRQVLKRTLLTEEGEVRARLVGDVVGLIAREVRGVERLELVPRNLGELDLDAGLLRELREPLVPVVLLVLAVRSLAELEGHALERLVTGRRSGSVLGCGGVVGTVAAAGTEHQGRSGHEAQHRTTGRTLG